MFNFFKKKIQPLLEDPQPKLEEAERKLLETKIIATRTHIIAQNLEDQLQKNHFRERYILSITGEKQ